MQELSLSRGVPSPVCGAGRACANVFGHTLRSLIFTCCILNLITMPSALRGGSRTVRAAASSGDASRRAQRFAISARSWSHSARRILPPVSLSRMVFARRAWHCGASVCQARAAKQHCKQTISPWPVCLLLETNLQISAGRSIESYWLVLMHVYTFV